MEKHCYKAVFFLFCLLGLINIVSAREASGIKKNASVYAVGCNPPQARTDLEINNVRATILAGSDMWWDLAQNPKYEVPKNSKKYSLFAGALWVGGVSGGSIKVAAQTYRQGGQYDFWTGPLDTTTVSIDKSECEKWDKHFVITRKEVEQFVNNGIQSPAVQTWPGNGDLSKNQGRFMAPFHDVDGDGIYNPGSGDYPNFNLGKGDAKKGYLLGDQVLWWVFNDKGNVHTSGTPSNPLGMEIQAQAFAFENKPGDPISNMTFYQYKIINRSTSTIDSTYFGQWVDPDLGRYDDDYVGCDVAKGLGFCYNGDEDDDGPKGYGLNPPAVGVDFFEGPLADPHDGIDNNRNGKIDEPNEDIIMSKFVYFNNDDTERGNPNKGTDFYNYLRGMWRDGVHMTYGGDGKGGGFGATQIQCDFMFPDNTDPKFSTAWNEVTANNTPADRRFIQSAGPFTLGPGAVNYITTGVVWARATSGGRIASVDLLKRVDAKAQALFESNFNKIKGPDAPDLAVRELNNELILTITNDKFSNNYKESYKEKDPDILQSSDSNYVFEGYQVFQLKDASVLGSYLDATTNTIDPTKAKIVAQCDVNNDVTQIVNYSHVTLGGEDQFQGAEMVYQAEDPNNGLNKGIRHTFRITKDLFATNTSRNLVNNQTYYFTVVAYAVNRTETKDPRTSPNGGSWTPYLSGTRNSKVYMAIPHNSSAENGGQILNSQFGSGPSIIRIEGQGNGGNPLDVVVDENKILNPPYKMDTITYAKSFGPLSVKVFDPVKVPKGNFQVKFEGDTATSRWIMTNRTTGEKVEADTSINVINEQIIPKWGLAVTINQASGPGYSTLNNNGVITSPPPMFSDSLNKWLTGIADNDIGGIGFDQATGLYTASWISAGKRLDDYHSADDNQYFEGIQNGTWAPFAIADSLAAFVNSINTKFTMGERKKMFAALSSVKIVITPDKDKWSRSCVVETHEVPTDVNGALKLLSLRKASSVGKDGKPDGTGDGMGWFPGYAINMETGERLNIIYGEDSFLASENGNDMLWNPTSNAVLQNLALLGGKHYLYVMSSLYDQCASYRTRLDVTGLTNDRKNVFKEAMWTTIPLLASSDVNFTDENGNKGGNIPPSGVVINLLVSKPFTSYKYASQSTKVAPEYRFSTDNLYNSTNNAETAKSAVDLIKIVPNPYYAHSDYESAQFENKVKITNLPAKCTVSIFTVNGTLIRTISKDNSGTDTSIGADKEDRNTTITNSLDWDLKNTAGIPISSGIYIFHVKSEGLPDKVIKWFGVIRPIDLSNY